MTLDGRDIDLDLLVKRVLSDLGMSQNRPTSTLPSVVPDTASPVGTTSDVAMSKQPEESQKSEAPQKVETPQESQAPQITDASENEEPVADGVEIRLTDRVISLATIKKVALSPTARNARRVVVTGQAVVTPSVRDELKKRHWELIFDVAGAGISNSSGGTNQVPHKGETSGSGQLAQKPVVIPPAFRPTFSPQTASMDHGPLLIAFHRLPVETVQKSLLDELDKSGSVTTYQNSCVVETAREIARFLAEKPGAKVILLTSYPAIASAVLNRRREIRALIGYDPARMDEEAVELGANVLTLDGKRVGFYAMQRMIRRFARIEAVECPVALRKGLE